MSNLTSKDWWAAAAVRALKTAAQVAVAAIGTTTVLGGVDWAMVASTAALSAILSILTSLGGLPEVDDKPKATTDTKEA